MKLLAPLSLAITMLIANPVAAQTPAVSPASQPASPHAAIKPEALSLADTFIALEYANESLEAGIRELAKQLFASDPDMMEMQRDYPGIDKVLIDTVRPFIIEHSEATRPMHRADLVRLFSETMTPEEMTRIQEFLTSAVGRKIISGTTNAMDYKNVSNEMVAQRDKDDFTLTSDAINADVGQAVGQVMTSLSAEERMEVILFGKSLGGRKLAQVKDAKRAIDMKWVNHPMSKKLEKRMGKAIEKAMTEHLVKSITE